jgi:hypothetical protein
VSITFAFLANSTRTRRAKAARNLCALVMELALAQVVLLDWFGAEIELQQGPPKSYRCTHARSWSRWLRSRTSAIGAGADLRPIRLAH